jgi:hypothetical protein
MRGQSPRPGVVLATAAALCVLNSGRAGLSGTVPVGTGPGVCCCWTLGIAIIVAADKIEIVVTFCRGPRSTGPFQKARDAGTVPATGGCVGISGGSPCSEFRSRLAFRGQSPLEPDLVCAVADALRSR